MLSGHNVNSSVSPLWRVYDNGILVVSIVNSANDVIVTVMILPSKFDWIDASISNTCNLIEPY